MKKEFLINLGKGVGYVLLMLIGVFSAFTVFAPDVAEALMAFVGLSSGGGFAVAATALVSGPDTRESAKSSKPDSAEKPGHLANDVSSIVTKIRPDKAPLDTMIRKMNNSQKATDIQVNFEEVEFRGRESALTAALAAPSSTTTPTTEDKYRSIQVGNPSLFIEGETIYIPTVLVDGKPLQLRIDEKNSDGTLKVAALNTPTGYVPAIPSTTVIYRGAPSAGELKAQVGSVTHYPDMRFNYCQRFMAQIEQSVIRGNIKSNSGFGWNDQNFMKMYDMRTSMELAHIFGTKSKTWSPKENDWVFTADGIYHQLEQNLEYTANSGINNDRWIDWTKELFSDDAGSSDRVLFGGKNLIAEILKIEMVQKQLESKQVEIVPGLKISVVQTNFGNVMIHHHKLFDSMGQADNGMIVDMVNIKKRPFQALKATELELRKSGQRNVRARLIDEISCLETRYLGTHARIIKSA